MDISEGDIMMVDISMVDIMTALWKTCGKLKRGLWKTHPPHNTRLCGVYVSKQASQTKNPTPVILYLSILLTISYSSPFHLHLFHLIPN